MQVAWRYAPSHRGMNCEILFRTAILRPRYCSRSVGPPAGSKRLWKEFRFICCNYCINMYIYEHWTFWVENCCLYPFTYFLFVTLNLKNKKIYITSLRTNINRISLALLPVSVFAFSAANPVDSFRFGPIVSVVRIQGDTMGSLPDRLRTRPLSRTASDTIHSKPHDRPLGTNGATHDARNESMRGNDVCADPYYPLLYREKRSPSPNPLCKIIAKKINQLNRAISCYLIPNLNLSPSWTMLWSSPAAWCPAFKPKERRN